ncbi:hypothetical protein NA57DRAFT_81702 [Rhizodiscina lignyota]|uniref:Uncharacterized protein n=1 Tax=Rhizodiscina lignyota TaxID=1504668 RepID=A0A9P4I133_9PEZI|nr:hypothetical protein NA57DRAFT_81702 [Rhizodiscina lignyota]
MDVYNAYNLGTAGWLATQAVPLLLTPRVIISLLSEEMKTATDLETYFCRCLSFSLLALAFMSLLLTGFIPINEFPEGETATTTPYAVPTLFGTMTYHIATAIYLYVRWNSGGTASIALGAVASGVLSVMGVWCLLFATDKGHISKRTGADKRTSGWPFKNEIADQKKGGKKGL